MRMRELEDLFTNPDYKPFTGRARKDICFPNSIYYDIHSKVAVLVLWESRQGWDHSLRESAINYLVDADISGRIAKGYVATAIGQQGDEGNCQIIVWRTVQQIWSVVKGVPTVAGEFGTYWWMTRELQLYERPIRADKGYNEPPF